MRKPIAQQSPAWQIVAEEQKLLERVRALLGQRGVAGREELTDFDRELLQLRDQIADEKLEDLPSLVEQMARVSAIASGRRGKVAAPIDASSPYFAHMRLRTDEKRPPQDVLIGRRGLIDRQAGVQIVDWRDAPVSQVYYRYEEGDDYEEEIGGSTLKGFVEARRNVTIAGGQLRRIGCPQGTFVGSADGDWYALEGQGVHLLEGGAGTAARPPRPAGRQDRRHRFETARPARGDNKQLPEIAALIDRAQFDLITQPHAGVVVIQGGAGSGKTTVALHRIAYLVFNDRSIKPSHCLFVVPSDALARYVAGVLPALGVGGVPVVTFRGFAQNLRRRLVPNAPDRYAEETPAPVARLKKHPALLPLLERAVATEVAQVRALLAERLGDAPGASWVLKAWDAREGEPPLERVRRLKSQVVHGKLDLQPPVAHAAEQALKRAQARLRDIPRILAELLTDRERLEALAAPGVVEPATRAEIEELVRWVAAQQEEESAPELEGVDAERLAPVDGLPLDAAGASAEEVARGRLDPEDDALMLRLFQLLHGQLERVDGQPLVYDHIAIDEAQDLSAVEVKVLHEALTERRSLTIAGDVAQRVIFDNAFRGWSQLLADVLGKDSAEAAAHVKPLRLAYRSTAQVMRFAQKLLGPLAEPDAEVAAREGAEVELHEFPGMGEAVAFVAEALRSLVGREPSASVALITRHAGQADAWYGALTRAEVPMLRRVRRQDFAFQPGIDVTDVSQVKGLEFDYVILLDVNEVSYPVSLESRHLLHIGATRATHQLWLVATGTTAELVREVKQSEEARETEAAS